MARQRLFRRRILSLPCVMVCMLSGCAALATLPPPPGAAGAAPTPIPAPPPPTTAQAGSTTVVAVAPPPQPCCKQTLPEWLGFSNCCQKIGRLLSAIPGLVGLFAPGLGNAMQQAATQPPLLPINSPQNLQSSNPAVQTAAQVMNDENQAPQKIAAIKYLATIGCGGCYPGVELSLLASLDDCTESVRFAAAKAFYDTTGRPCTKCNAKACCSIKARQKLSAIAYDMKDETCYVESSPRVRRMARLALMNCGSDCPAPGELLPIEGPAIAPQPATPGLGTAPPPAPAAAPTAVPPSPQASARSKYGSAVADTPESRPETWTARTEIAPSPVDDAIQILQSRGTSPAPVTTVSPPIQTVVYTTSQVPEQRTETPGRALLYSPSREIPVQSSEKPWLSFKSFQQRESNASLETSDQTAVRK